MNTLLSITKNNTQEYRENYSVQFYSVFLFKGQGRFSVDFVDYNFDGLTVLFLAPYQNFLWDGTDAIEIQLLQFHGDFYCIEYHKQEIACNGLLFNNIYLQPHITVTAGIYAEVLAIFTKMQEEKSVYNSYSEAILKTYLQLVLALCSKEKSKQLREMDFGKQASFELLRFQNLIEKHFKSERSPSFYASALAMTPGALSKKIKKEFGKTPTQLIQDRVVLEAKKLLHLTHQSIKEIAFELNFEDEFYFSRYFKKVVGFSPLHYRENVGISIVAK